MSTPTFRVVAHLSIAGMTSVHATRAIFTALAGLEGVIKGEVERGRALIEHDGRVTLDQLRETIALAGFEVLDAREERRTLPIL